MGSEVSTWTFAAYIARLKHESRGADTERGMTRLRRTIGEVATFLNETDHDPDDGGWIRLLREYEIAAEIGSIRHEWPDGCNPTTSVV